MKIADREPFLETEPNAKKVRAGLNSMEGAASRAADCDGKVAF